MVKKLVANHADTKALDTNGKTAYERLKGKTFKKPLVEFAECVHDLLMNSMSFLNDSYAM